MAAGRMRRVRWPAWAWRVRVPRGESSVRVAAQVGRAGARVFVAGIDMRRKVLRVAWR